MEEHVMDPHPGINHKKDQSRQLAVPATDGNEHEPALGCHDLRINLRPIKEHKIIEKDVWSSTRPYKNEQLHNFTVNNDAQDEEIKRFTLPQCTDVCKEHCDILEPLVEQGMWGSVGKVLENDVCPAHRGWAILEACKRANDSDVDHYILPHTSHHDVEFALVTLTERCLWVSAGRLSERRRWKGQEILQSKRTATEHDHALASTNSQKENINVSNSDCTIVLKKDEDMLARNVQPSERKEICETFGHNLVNSYSELRTNLNMCSVSMTASLNPEANRHLEDCQLKNKTVCPEDFSGFNVHDHPQASINSQEENISFGNTDCTIVQKNEDIFPRNVKPSEKEETCETFVPGPVNSHSELSTNLKVYTVYMTASLNLEADHDLEDCRLLKKSVEIFEETGFKDTLLTVCPKELNVRSEASVLPYLDDCTKGAKPESFIIPKQSKDKAWRKESFRKMTDPPTDVDRYANEGFYYDSNLCRIACFNCRLQIKNWRDKKNLGVLHTLNKCRFMAKQVFKTLTKRSETQTNASIQQQLLCSSENETDPESDRVSLSRETITTPESTSLDQVSHSERSPGLEAAQNDYAKLENSQAIITSYSPTVTHSENVPGEAQNVLENKEKASPLTLTIACTEANENSERLPERLNQRNNNASKATEEQDSQQLVSLYMTKNVCQNYLDMTKAVSPEYCLVSARLATFSSWPSRGLPDKRCLVIAGFYFLGARDSVRCFFCGVTLKNWRADDDVWETHARFRFSCDYVVCIKGDDFILRTMVKLANGGVIPADRQFIAISAERNDRETDKSSASITICSSLSNVRSADESISNVESASISNPFSNPPTSANVDTNMNTPRDKTPAENDLIQTSTSLQNQKTCASNYFATKHKAMDNIYGTSDKASDGNPLDLQTDAAKDIYTQLPAGNSMQQTNIVARVDEAPTQRPTSVSTEHPVSRHSSKLTGAQDLHTWMQQLTDTNRRLRQQRTCRLCAQRGVDTIFLPCGHLCTCECCAATIRKCCLCSQRIRGTAHVFLE